MSIQINQKFKVNGREYYGANHIGFDDGTFVLDLCVTDPANHPYGIMFMVIPISSKEYRRTRPTACGYSATSRKLTLYDDWGSSYTIVTSIDHIQKLISELEAEEVPVKPEK